MRLKAPIGALAAATAVLAVAGCGENIMPQADVEKQAAIELAKVVGVPASEVPPISCPGDLKAKVGVKMTCVLGEPGQKQYDTYITVTRVDEGSEKAFFDVKVAETPKS